MLASKLPAILSVSKPLRVPHIWSGWVAPTFTPEREVRPERLPPGSRGGWHHLRLNNGCPRHASDTHLLEDHVS